MKKALTYNEAIKRWPRHEVIGVLPQPNRQLSDVKGSTWHLENVNGPIGKVLGNERVVVS